MIGQKGIPAHYGGVEKHVHDLSVRLVQAGHDVTVYSRTWYAPKKETMVDGVHAVFVPTIRTKHLDAFVHSLFSTIHAVFAGYDVIHYHSVGPSLVSFIPRMFSRKTRVITTFHCIDRENHKWGGFARSVLRIGEWTATKFAHTTITVSETLQKYCKDKLHAETVYIPNAVDEPVMPTSTNHIKKFGLEKDKYLVTVLRLVRHKGVHLLIDAFITLKKRYPLDPVVRDLKLAIVGGSAYTDDYVRELHKQAAHFEDIVFTDFQSGDALNELYAHAKAFVHPSLNEGLPISVLQAMSMARPVLVSDIPQHLELVSDPRAIFVQNNAKALAVELHNFLRLRTAEQKEMGKKNTQIVQKRYSWEVIFPQILSLYSAPEARKKKATVLIQKATV